MKEDSVVEWYAGRTLFVTGGTGFMGKVLLEKLLRCCPDLKRIYVLCRPKKGFSPVARMEEMSKLPVFDRLRKANPNVFKKLVAVEGDIMQKDLGIHPEIREALINEVSVVFNGAASLRLEAGLKPAIEHNTIGTQKILDLACQMKHLKAFVHLSTAFCHCEYEQLDEIVYPTPISPADVIQAVQWMDESTLNMITPKLLGPHPNCYTFSKRLTESLVSEYAERIPVAIARPSIVTPAMEEPMPGWVDSLNGPVGVVVAAGKGLIRSMMVAEEFAAEVIPVDIAINAIIAIAWERGRKPKETDELIPVYNVTNGNVESMTWGEVFKIGKKLSYEYPFEAGLWYPNGQISMNPVSHYLVVFFFQIIPAYFIDLLLFLIGSNIIIFAPCVSLMGVDTFVIGPKTGIFANSNHAVTHSVTSLENAPILVTQIACCSMVRVQKRIYVGMQVLQYFTTRRWSFNNQRVLDLSPKLNEKEQKIFYISNFKPDKMKYLVDILLGARQYVMKEPLSTLPKARMQLKMLYWLDWVAQILFYGLLSWYALKLFNLQGIFTGFAAK